MENLFQQYKTREQIGLLEKEIGLLRQSLADFQKDYKKILALKRHFMSGGQYHNVLQTWRINLDAIFNLAERHMK